MQSALLAALHDDPLPAASPPPEPLIARQPNRRPRVTFALLGMALALVLCVATAFPAMSSPGTLELGLVRYASLLVDALSGASGAAPTTMASPISLSGAPDPDGSRPAERYRFIKRQDVTTFCEQFPLYAELRKQERPA